MDPCRVSHWWVPFGLVVLLQFQSTNSHNPTESLGSSKLILFQGKTRFEVQGQDCPVGISFTKPELFSCACVTGVWGFYEEECSPPVKVIGGLHHCFLMPPLWIRQVMVWSNVQSVLGPTLTIFDGDEEYVKLKVYRNTHMTVSRASAFVAHNSSWTLLNRNGSKVCLNSDTSGIQDRFHSKVRDQSGRVSAYCHFSHVNSLIQEVDTFKPGCAGKLREVKPDRCEYFEESNGEFICTQPEVLDNYERLKLVPGGGRRHLSKHTSPSLTTATLAPTFPASFSPLHVAAESRPIGTQESLLEEETSFGNGWNSNEDWQRRKKSLELEPKSPQTLTAPKVNVISKPATTLISLPPGRGGDPASTSDVSSRGNQKLPIYIDFPPDGTEEEVKRGSNPVFPAAPSLNEGTFLAFNPSESNPFVLSNLWAYQKLALLTLLNLKREDDLEVSAPNQILQLLNISKLIMQGTCDLVRPEFFSMATDVFINVQRKELQWKVPFIPNPQFQRILSSLQNCLQRAQPLTFLPRSGCRFQEPKSVYWNGTERPLEVSQVFSSDGFEPIIESVWKMILNAHSYCYADFSHFYNDHHYYTTLFTPIFTNGIYQIWFRNTTLPREYNGVAGNMDGILRQIELCVTASRHVSNYPWDVSRPDLGGRVYSGFKRKRRDLRSKKIRVQLPQGAEAEAERTRSNPIPKEPPAISSPLNPGKLPGLLRAPLESWEWKKNRRILGGLGFCVKKFDEPRTKLGQICE